MKEKQMVSPEYVDSFVCSECKADVTVDDIICPACGAVVSEIEEEIEEEIETSIKPNFTLTITTCHDMTQNYEYSLSCRLVA